MSLIDPHYNDVSHCSLDIVPRPNFVKRLEGQFTLQGPISMVAVGESLDCAKLLSAQLELQADIQLPLAGAVHAETRSIVLLLDPSSESFGREGYSLTASPDSIRLIAAEPAGLFYACQTLLQLLPATRANEQLHLPCVEIHDSPRFPWRGVMLDVARFFMPVEFIKKFIDALALHKINVLQLHLNDDQGWRIEIKKYPKLTEVGAHRDRTLVGFAHQSPRDADFDPSLQTFDDIPHGGYYTQDEARDIVAYAAARHITIVPEIEMPGHAQAAIAAYPELGCTGEQLEVSPRWGIHDNLYEPSETSFAFLQDVLTEVMSVFPSTYIHVGGDEAVKRQWKESPFCQNLMAELEIANEEGLQSYFISRIDAFLSANGRILIGWDEILQGGLADDAVVMSWRGEKTGVTAANLGHDVVMAPYQYTYFDYYQSEDRTHEPLAFPELITLRTVYDYEPVPSDLPDQYAHHILGAQGQLWTEYMPHPDQVEYMAFPRVSALAEVTWTNQNLRDYDDFVRRLPVQLERLKALGIRYRPLDSEDTVLYKALAGS